MNDQPRKLWIPAEDGRSPSDRSVPFVAIGLWVLIGSGAALILGWDQLAPPALEAGPSAEHVVGDRDYTEPTIEPLYPPSEAPHQRLISIAEARGQVNQAPALRRARGAAPVREQRSGSTPFALDNDLFGGSSEQSSDSPF